MKTKLTGIHSVLTSYRVLYLHDKHIPKKKKKKKKCCKKITMIKSVYKYWLQNKKIKKNMGNVSIIKHCQQNSQNKKYLGKL